ncbi:hypothetical protein [Hymenobacter rubidus]|uniref:hypothetical protein n=1 Tax=Hymenobacter rubidus TaxID=1441626 RepID=UPI00191D851B|nr:hypothetical protein [Hymenobacter rubidus]
MKKLFLLLLVLFGLADTASAQAKPKVKARAFKHTSESGKGKTERMHFRQGRKHRSTLDLTPGKLEKFKSAKANKNYTFPNPHK